MEKRVVHLIGFIVIASFFIPAVAIAQDDWKWAIHGSGTNSITELLTTDKYNNSYFAVYYNDTLTFNHQSYYHPHYYSYYYNCLLLKVDPYGKLLKQMDIFTPPSGTVRPLKMVADTVGNLFLGGPFQVRVFIGDTVINHLPVPYYEMEEAFLAKFNNQLEITWAKVIGCEHYLYFSDLKLRGNHLCYVVNSYSYPSQPVIMYCFGQDTLSYFDDQSHVNIFTLDLNGQIQSMNEIHGLSCWAESFENSENGDLYISGITWDTLWVNNSIALYSTNLDIYSAFILHLDPNLNLINAGILDTNIPTEFKLIATTPEDELYFSVITSNYFAISGDTIPVPYVNTWIFGKLDTQRHIVWYEKAMGLDNTGDYPSILYGLLQDTLYVALDFPDHLYLKDTIIYNTNGWEYENHILKYGPDGNRICYAETNTTSATFVTGLGFDNCNNIILAGDFQGTAIYGKDTLVSREPYGNKFDFFITYLDKEHREIDFMDSIIACNQLLISGPPGWDHYNWNNGLGTHAELLITESGKYTLEVWNDSCCFMKDSIIVIILPLPEIDLGNDITIKKSHSVELTAPAGFTSYTWSTGATEPSIVIQGNTLQTVITPIWCLISDGYCMNRDTILVEVINDDGIDESETVKISVSPNPFYDRLNIVSEEPMQDVNIMDMTGKLVKFHSHYLNNNLYLELDFDESSSSILFIRVETNKHIIALKAVRMRK
jgi:hypothetical protein